MPLPVSCAESGLRGQQHDKTCCWFAGRSPTEAGQITGTTTYLCLFPCVRNVFVDRNMMRLLLVGQSMRGLRQCIPTSHDVAHFCLRLRNCDVGVAATQGTEAISSLRFAMWRGRFCLWLLHWQCYCAGGSRAGRHWAGRGSQVGRGVWAPGGSRAGRGV